MIFGGIHCHRSAVLPNALDQDDAKASMLAELRSSAAENHSRTPAVQLSGGCAHGAVGLFEFANVAAMQRKLAIT